jgi:DNA-binding FadR family transcriptional regulator
MSKSLPDFFAGADIYNYEENLMVKLSNPEPATLPLNRGGAADQILADLRDQILQGMLARGTKLPSERELAQRYQVSAPTIREAIRGLAAVRLVEVRHGTGMYVTAAADLLFTMATSALIQLEKIDLLDILDILEMLYVKTAMLACTHATDEELVSLASALDSVERGNKVDDVANGLKVFLELLADASHNALISTLCKFLVSLVIEMAREDSKGMIDNWRKIAGKLRSDRRKLVEALQTRNVVQATLMAAKYHRHTRSLVRDRLTVNDGETGASMHRAFKRMAGGL